MKQKLKKKFYLVNSSSCIGWIIASVHLQATWSLKNLCLSMLLLWTSTIFFFLSLSFSLWTQFQFRTFMTTDGANIHPVSETSLWSINNDSNKWKPFLHGLLIKETPQPLFYSLSEPHKMCYFYVIVTVSFWTSLYYYYFSLMLWWCTSLSTITI